MTLGERIRKYRQAMGMTQSNLAEVTGKSESSISQYERGHTMPHDDGIERIAAAFGISVHELILPKIDSIEGVLQAFLFIEDRYGMFPVRVGDKVMLSFSDEHFINELLDDWEAAYSEYVDGVCQREEYNTWRASYI